MSGKQDIVDQIPQEGIASADLYKQCDWFDTQIAYCAALGRATQAGKICKRNGLIYKLSSQPVGAEVVADVGPVAAKKPTPAEQAPAAALPRVHPAIAAIKVMAEKPARKIEGLQTKKAVLTELGKILDPEIGVVLQDILQDLEAVG